MNYNSSQDCQTCLKYLRNQDYSDLSIIVVDNNSSKGGETVRLKQICQRGETLILNDRNGGFSAGNNIGLKAAVKGGADWMLVINPDVELRDPHYISYVMEQLPNWPQAAVVGTNVLLPTGQKQNPMREVRVWEEILWPGEMISQRLGYWKGYRSQDKTGYCEKVSGCCFFISKEFLQANNYLDEKVFMYCEEPILGKSVLSHGYRELYINEVTANHEHYARRKEGSSKEKMQQFLKSRIYYIQTYSGYGRFGKSLSVFSRSVQKWIWKKFAK